MQSNLSIIAFAVLGFLGTAVAAPTADEVEQKYPDIIAAKVRARDNNIFDFDVTISSPYDTAQRYADAFRVMGTDGKVYGERTLFHDHASEQPFTRDLYAVEIPSAIGVVVIQGRDRRFGYGGKPVEVSLPGRKVR